ncbi:MAG: hypothetical protein PHE02_10840 [Lachnospiraceae bacterium]|nr:hypothetical protein [Lachnospiraceae bacterium]
MKVLLYAPNEEPTIISIEERDAAVFTRAERNKIGKIRIQIEGEKDLVILYKESYRIEKDYITAIYRDNQQTKKKRQILYGKFIVCGYENGTYLDVDEDTIKLLKNKIIPVITNK